MPEIPALENRPFTPTDSEIDRLLYLTTYFRSYFSLRIESLYDKEDKSKYEKEVGAEETIITFSKKHYDGLKSGRSRTGYLILLERLYEHITRTRNSQVKNPWVDDVHEWVRPLICDTYPELIGYFAQKGSEMDANPDHQLSEAAKTGRKAVAKVIQCFGGTSFVYRYARNDDTDDIRIAKGRLEVPEKASRDRFPPFQITYKPNHRETDGETVLYEIHGHILPIQIYFVFVGVERQTDYPFFMVVKDDGKHEAYGALMLRKHKKRSFLASKGMISFRKPLDAELGQRQFDEVPEITPKLQEILRNIGAADGYGAMVIPDL